MQIINVYYNNILVKYEFSIIFLFHLIKHIFFRFNSAKDRENIFKSKWRQEILDKLIKLRLQEKEFQNITSFAF